MVLVSVPFWVAFGKSLFVTRTDEYIFFFLSKYFKLSSLSLGMRYAALLFVIPKEQWVNCKILNCNHNDHLPSIDFAD